MAWITVIMVAAGAAILSFILLLILKRWFNQSHKELTLSDAERGRHLQSGIARLHQVSPHHSHHHFDKDNHPKKTSNSSFFRRGFSAKPPPPFDWADHPSLVTDAVENGWSRFAFTNFVSLSPPSAKSVRSLLGVHSIPSYKPVSDTNVEIAWEVCEGSADFMEKIRLNPNLNTTTTATTSLKNGDPLIGAVSVIRTGLPLPGPNLGNSSFPQEAYFEITILCCSQNARGLDAEEMMKKVESQGDKTKLINGENGNNDENLKIGNFDWKKEAVLLSVGLSGGGPLPLKIPGSYQGSIGFKSTGAVYLDERYYPATSYNSHFLSSGTKLIAESQPDDWGKPGKVIGCGFNPTEKRVFFTVDSQISHEIHCKTEEFSYPLYPTIAANSDITVLVNLGQSAFKFAPANASRTPNPCFVGPMQGSTPSSSGYDDSKELFSMGRIDSQWQRRSGNRSSNNDTVNSIKSSEYEESDGELFEIVLDGRSPYTAVYQ